MPTAVMGLSGDNVMFTVGWDQIEGFEFIFLPDGREGWALYVRDAKAVPTGVAYAAGSREEGEPIAELVRTVLETRRETDAEADGASISRARMKGETERGLSRAVVLEDGHESC